MSRLSERAVTRLVGRFADDLTARQSARLQALAKLIDPAGRIPLAQALQVATPDGDEQTRQAAFRKFRASVAEATGAQLRLVADTRKTSPESRYCWFEGADETSHELAERSERESRRHTGDRVVAPAAAEVLDPPQITVYVSTAGTAGPATAGRERAFIELLRERLAVCGDRRYRVTSMHDTAIGVERATHRHRLREEADVLVALTSPAYLGDSGGDDAWAAHHPERRLLFALEKLPAEASARHLPLGQVQLVARPFSYRTTQPTKVEYVDDCLGAIYAAVSRLETPARARRRMPPAPPDDPDLGEWAQQQLFRRLDDGVLVRSRASETSLHEGLATELGRSDRVRHLGEPVSAVDRLVTWATRGSADAPPLCALLGDVGMGKTTTTKLFTQKLLQLRTDGQDVPLPILFDLRDLPVSVVQEGPHLRRIVDCLLEASASGRRPSAEEVLDLVNRGNCVLIFDGLDEILVHLSPHQGQVFTRTLWRATEDAWLTRHDPDTGDRPDTQPGPNLAAPHPPVPSPAVPSHVVPSKLLLSCRTHYFRSVREETAHFTGQHRDGPVARDYLALVMLPFSEEQIREYLAGNVPDADVDTLMALIGSVHNLREIAERPLTLRMISQQLELVEQATLAGRVVRPVDLYASFVEQWLSRDNGKHSLLPQHKQVLMEHLAAELWRSGRLGWSTADVEQWLLEFLAARPDLELHYTSRTPDLWKEDLRTATFLIRQDDDAYTFAHTSLREYFLARYLARALDLDPDQLPVAEQRWRMPVPSRETLAFLGQQLAGLAPQQWRRCHATLSALATAAPEPGPAGDRPQVSPAAVLAFAYGLAATAAGYPHHRLAGSRLDGADLRRWHIGAGDQAVIDLRGIGFAGADLSDAMLDWVDLRDAHLSGANLTRTELHHSDLRGLDARGGTLVGTILRGCRLHGARWAAATAHRAQAVACEPPHEPALPGWLLAPSACQAPPGARLASLTGHTDWVWGCAYSPDGTRLVTTSDDGTARVWDAATGEPLLTLTGHTDWVRGCGYSPDGTRLVTTSTDGTARVWDAATGEPLLTLTGHTDWVRGCGYSPDGTRIITASDDGTARVWDAGTGEPLLTLTGHTDWVQGCGYSPDGTRIVTTSGDGTARVWDAATGEPLLTLTGHTSTVWGCGYSPDGSRIVTASGDGTARVWDAGTGELLLTLTGHTGTVLGCAYSPDGTRIVTTSDDGTARVWDAGTGEPLLTLTGHTGTVLGCGYSPDGTRLVTTSGDRTARVWDAGTGEPLLTLTGHTSAVLGCGYSPDGCRVVTASTDRTARAWDAGTGEPLLTLTGHTGTVWGCGYSPDGTRIVTASADGTARVWDAATGHQLGWQLEQLPDDEQAVWSVPARELLGASPGAWRWLGWQVPIDGVLTRLPAESFGALPPLSRSQSTPAT